MVPDNRGTLSRDSSGFRVQRDMHIHLRLHRRQSRLGGMDITVAIFIFIIGIIINFIFVAVVVVVAVIN